MAIFNSYVSLPEGKESAYSDRWNMMKPFLAIDSERRTAKPRGLIFTNPSIFLWSRWKPPHWFKSCDAKRHCKLCHTISNRISESCGIFLAHPQNRFCWPRCNPLHLGKLRTNLFRHLHGQLISRAKARSSAVVARHDVPGARAAWNPHGIPMESLGEYQNSWFHGLMIFNACSSEKYAAP